MKAVKTKNVHLNTFGDDKFKKQKCDIVKLKLKDRYNGYHSEIEINAFCFPTICSPLPVSNLKLADEYQTECSERPIDLLIGSDNYYEMITGDIIRGDIGPVAVNSIFGYMLCGTMSKNQSDELHISSNLVIQGHCETLTVKNTKSDELVDNLKRFWEIDSMGLNDDENENKEHEFLKDIDFVNKGIKSVCLRSKTNLCHLYLRTITYAKED